jgi:hypothetical protein
VDQCSSSTDKARRYDGLALMRRILKGGCVMTRGVNWTRISSRNRMRRQGVEDIKGKRPLDGQPPKFRRRLSKAELREQAAAAFLAWREGQKAKDK